LDVSFFAKSELCATEVASTSEISFFHFLLALSLTQKLCPLAKRDPLKRIEGYGRKKARKCPVGLARGGVWTGQPAKAQGWAKNTTGRPADLSDL